MKSSTLRTPLALAAALFSLSACGDDSTGPETPNVAGTWSLSLANMSGSGITCDWTGLTADVEQDGSTFTGTYDGGTYSCTNGDQTVSGDAGSGTILDGSIDGNDVSFAIDDSDNGMTGTVSGGSMSGTGTLFYDFGYPYGVVELSGDWAATKN